MKPYQDVIEIDLRILLQEIGKKLDIIIISTLVGGIAAAVISFLIITPVYTSTAEVYIMVNSGSEIDMPQLQLSSELTLDYIELVKSKTVIEAVIEKLGLPIQYEDFLEHLTVDNPKGTRILKFTVRYKDPYLAKQITENLVEIFQGKVSKIMQVSGLTVVQEASFSKEAVSPKHIKNIMMGLLIGFLMPIGIVVLLYILDDTLKSTDDIEKYLGLNTLAVIPEEDSTWTKIWNKRWKYGICYYFRKATELQERSCQYFAGQFRRLHK